MPRHRGTTTGRGLGAGHQAMRCRLLPAALGTPCPGPWTGPRSPRCTGAMVDRKLMDLDEDPPRAFGDNSTPRRKRICCTPCNRSHGARLGNRMRARTRAATALPRW